MAKPGKEMRRVVSKRSHSWWWDSHISPKNSKWLAENLEEMDRSVKRMLKLIEEDGDSFAKKADMYYQKRPELISHVEDFYRMYRSLAERYDHVTGELRKNIPSELQSQGSGSDFGSEPPTPSPERKTPSLKLGHRAAGFDVFLGSGGSSDLSRKGSVGSYSSSDSGSESDEATSKSHLSGPLENGDDDDDDNLHRRMFELENELKVTKDRLRATEEENSTTLLKATENGNYNELQVKISELEQQLMVTNEKLQLSEQEITRLNRELENNKSSEIISALELQLGSSRKEKSSLESELESARRQVESLEAELETCRKENKLLQSELELEKICISEMQERIVGLEANVAGHECKIKEMRVTMADDTTRYAQEKLELEAEISGLSEKCLTNEAKLQELEFKGLSLTDRTVQLEADKLEMQAEIVRAKFENAKKSENMEELIRNLDAQKLKYDMLEAERDEVSAKVLALVADVSSREDRICEMDEHLNRLHLDHARLIAGTESVQKLVNELRVKVKELEEEAETQRAVIADNAEAKREAIRQLCFSLEHYRDGYIQLRQALHGHKRRAVMAV
ncbi:protein NETWORKED 4A [Cinnamomum micranthum f. kanehirae]|uniref:Protein NETWORKED 4A n=1 Tax=Cinnamomum micranthum f. kanehirae TaxID=337451 RepID=A0A3S3MMG9_9MAGN|nr:protein NETWORKED 4A [Cinnamomum micranthum f. kanehirae]